MLPESRPTNPTPILNANGYRWIGIGAVFGLLSVGLGAFGAHGLQDYLKELGADDPELAVKRLANWNTAAQYQMYHAISIVIIGVLLCFQRSKLLSAAASCFAFGIVLFSGLLYCLVLLEKPILGAIVPLGGVSLMTGWLLLAIAAFRLSASNSTSELQ